MIQNDVNLLEMSHWARKSDACLSESSITRRATNVASVAISLKATRWAIKSNISNVMGPFAYAFRTCRRLLSVAGRLALAVEATSGSSTPDKSALLRLWRPGLVPSLQCLIASWLLLSVSLYLIRKTFLFQGSYRVDLV